MSQLEGVWAPLLSSGRGKDAVKHCIVNRTAPTTKNYMAPNTNSDAVEKPCSVEKGYRFIVLFFFNFSVDLKFLK